MKSDNLLIWMRTASPDQRQDVADMACSGSVNYLYQLASGHRGASPEKAVLIERAIRAINQRDADDDLPDVSRHDLTDFFANLDAIQATG